MGTDTLTDHVDGQIIDADDVNIIHRALEEDVVGRNASGAPEAGKRLGTPLIPWGSLYATDLIIDGNPIDVGAVTSVPNRIISGRTRTSSAFPAFLSVPASGFSFTILGATTPLRYDVNGVIAEITSDIVVSGLTPGPSTNNTCQINDASLTGQDVTRFLGDNGGFIPVDNMQSELTSRIGEFVVLINETSLEALYCRIKSSTELDQCKRGFAFDSTVNPRDARVLNNNDVLRILRIGFIFAENDGSTIDVSYSNPVISGVEPAIPVTGQYWLDLSVQQWKRYNGSIFEVINRTFIGFCAMGPIGTLCRPEQFGKSYQPDNTLNVRLLDVDTAISSKPDFFISVDAEKQKYDFGFLTWAASSDFETGFTRTANRYYWLYITEEGKPKISGYKPYNSLYFQKGWYHPHESWRAVGEVYNNASNQFELVYQDDANLQHYDGFQLLPFLSPISNNATDPNNDIDFSPRCFTFQDYAGTGCIQNSFTKRLDAVWSAGTNGGGLDTGTKAANTTYHCYAIYSVSQNTGDYIFSLSASAPTLPTGYDKYRRIGSIITNASANILGFKQRGKWFNWNVWINEWDLMLAPSTRTNYTWTLPTGVKVRANMNTFIQTAVANKIGGVIISDPDSPNQAPNIGPGPIFSLLVQRTSAANNVNGAFHVTTNTSAQVALRGTIASPTSEGAVEISAVNIGWEDYQLEE